MILYLLGITIVIILTLVFVTYMFPLALVQGSSMYPTLKHNEVLLTCKVLRKKNLKDGEMYVFKSKTDDSRMIIKRLIHQTHGECFFLGDNPEESYDSREYGYVKAENIKARVLINTKYKLK